MNDELEQVVVDAPPAPPPSELSADADGDGDTEEFDSTELEQEVPESDGVKAIVFGSEVKSTPTEDGAIAAGYLVMYGSPDVADFDGDYFTRDTDFDLDPVNGEEYITIDGAQKRVYAKGKSSTYFNHGLDKQVGKNRLSSGQKADLYQTDDGVWIEARLKEGEQYDRMVLKLMQKRKPGWSSGVPAHLIERVQKGGAHWIKKWSLGTDASITHTPNDWRNVAVLKGVMNLEDLHIDADIQALLENDESALGEADGLKGAQKDVIEEGFLSALHSFTQEDAMNINELALEFVKAASAKMNDNGMTDEEKEAVAKGVLDALKLSPAADAAPVMEDQTQVKAIAEHVAAAFQNQQTRAQAQSVAANAVKSAFADQTPASRVGGGVQATKNTGIESVVDRKYDRPLDDLVFSLAHHELVYRKGSDVMPPPDVRWYKAVHAKLERELGKGNSAYNEDEFALKSMLRDDDGEGTWARAVKANEIYTTDNGSITASLIQTAYSSMMIAKVRETPIYQQILAQGVLELTIPQGAQTIKIPREATTDPTFRTFSQTASLDSDGYPPPVAASTLVDTDETSITAGNVGAEYHYGLMAEEDTYINLAAYARNKMARAWQEQMERIILSGDTSVLSANINYDGSAVSADSAGRTPSWTVTNGFAQLPLITTTSLSWNVGAGVDENTFLRLRYTLPSAENGDLSRLLYVIDESTEQAILSLETFKNKDYGDWVAVQNGRITGIYGVPVYRSGFFGDPTKRGRAGTNGKVNATASSNTTGRILLIRPDRWMIATKRQMMTEVERSARAQVTSVISTMRFGMKYMNSAGGAALAYNITVPTN